MATCKECFHVDVCRKQQGMWYDFSSEPVKAITDVENRCDQFIDSAATKSCLEKCERCEKCR